MGIKKESVLVEQLELLKEKQVENIDFYLADDVWQLAFRETRAIHEGLGKIYFHNIPKFLRNKVKFFIADAWLNKNLSNGSLKNYKRAVDEFLLFAEKEYGGEFKEENFNRAAALSFEIYLDELDIGQSTKRFIYDGIKVFSLFLNEYYAEEIGEGFYFRNERFSQVTPKGKKQEDKTIPLEICYKIMEAIKKEEMEIEETLQLGDNKNNAVNYAKNRFVYCQILKLILATGRRASHIINLEEDCYRMSDAKEAKGVWIRWNETKTNQGFQEVFVPEPLSDIIVDGINKTKEMTKELKQRTTDTKYLFLVSGNPKESKKFVKRPEYKNFMSFINGQSDRIGFMQKHAIYDEEGNIFHLKAHALRHTRFNEMRKQGVGIGTIQNDAKHLSLDMTTVYINSDEIAQKEFFEKVEKDELKGDAVDFIKNKKVKNEKFTKEELERYRKNGMAVQLTHYGYCHLEIEAGPCPSGNPCWIGTDGCGCKYHLYTKENIQTIEEDVEVYKMQKEMEEQMQPNSPLIGHYNAIINRYEELKREVEST